MGKAIVLALCVAVAVFFLSLQAALREPFPRVPDRELDNPGWRVLEDRYIQPYFSYSAPYGKPLTKPAEKYVDSAGRARQHDLDGEPEARIGFMGCLSGPAKAYSENMLKGVTMALDEVNAAGGVRGKKAVLKVRNDKGDMGTCGEEWVKLIYDDRVLGILGSMGSDATHVGIRVSLKNEVPSLTSISTDPTITQVFTVFSFRCLADDWSQGRAMAKLLLFDLGLKKIAVLQQNSRYGRMGVQELSRVYQRRGFPVGISLKFEGKARDFSAQVAIIRDYEPEAVVIWGLYTPAAKIVTQLRAAGIRCPVFGSDGVVSDRFPALAGKAAEGVITTMPYDFASDDPVNVEFLARYRKRYGGEPDSFSAHGYDAARIMCAAITEGGFNRTKVRDALARVKGFPGVTGRIGFDQANNDTRTVLFAKIVKGKFVPLRLLDRKDYLK